MTDLGPPLFFWVMLGLAVAAFIWAVAALRRRPAMAVFGAVLGVLIGLAIWYFANTGVFCVAPLRSACA
jgi:succinate-acetate transporter protein